MMRSIFLLALQNILDVEGRTAKRILVVYQNSYDFHCIFLCEVNRYSKQRKGVFLWFRSALRQVGKEGYIQ